MLSTTTRSIASELGAPETVERSARWLEEVSWRTAAPSPRPLVTSAGFGEAGRAAQEFSMRLMARNQSGTLLGAGNSLTNLLDRYKISSTELQGFSGRLIH